MRKDEYLNKIAQELRQYDKFYVDEILRDYEEHFQDAMEHGKSEEEICRELGNVEDIVKEVKELMETERPENFQVGRPESSLTNQEEQTGYSRRSSHNSGYYNGNAEKVNSIRFSSGSADVQLIPSSDGRFRIYTENPSCMKYLEHNFTENTYSGRFNIRREGSDLVSLGTQILMGIFGWITSEVIIEVPEGTEQICIDSLSGDITVKGISVRNLELRSASGDFEIHDTESQRVLLSTKSGDLSLKKTRTEKLEVKTISGDVRYKEVIANQFICETVSGDIVGHRLESRNLAFKTVSGDVAVNLQCLGEMFYVYIKTVSGDVLLRGGIRVSEQEFYSESLKENIRARINTVSGDVLVGKVR